MLTKVLSIYIIKHESVLSIYLTKHENIEYESVKEDLIKYKCLSCNKDYSNTIDE